MKELTKIHSKLVTKLVITLLIMSVSGLIFGGGCQQHSEQDSATSTTALRLSFTLVPDTDLDLYIYAEQNSPTLIPSGIISMASDIEVESFAVWGASEEDEFSFGLGIMLTNAHDAARLYDEIATQDDFWKMLSGNTLYAVYGSGSAAERLKTAISNNDFKYYNDSESLAMAATLPDYGVAGPIAITVAKPTYTLKDFIGQYVDPGYLEPLNEVLESAHIKVIAAGLYSPQQIDIAQVAEILSGGSSIADLDLGMVISVRSTFPSFLVEPAVKNYLTESGFTETKVGDFTLFKGGWSIDEGMEIPVIIRIEGNLILVAVAGEESYAETLLTNGSISSTSPTSPTPTPPPEPTPEPITPIPTPTPVRPPTPAFVTAMEVTGASTGEVNQPLIFSTGASYNIAGIPEYRFDWGDGSKSDWSSTYIRTHSWSDPGTYTVKARAKISDTYSEWSSGKVIVIESEPLPVSKPLPRNPFKQPEAMMSYITPNDPHIESAVDDIMSGEWRWAYSDFDALRQWVSTHVNYKYDYELHGVTEYWQLPSETLELGKGDCEDFAILLCTLLRAYGVPFDQVYVACAFSEGEDQGHAFLFERYYTGIWRAIEPQAGVWHVFVLGDIDPSEYDRFYCFNDQHYLTDKPTLPLGEYEFEAGYSFWPTTRGASLEFERYLDTGERVTGLVQWGKDSLGEHSDRIYDWTITAYDQYDNAVFTWSGNELSHEFSFAAQQPGNYRIEILKRDYTARYGIMAIDPQDWVQK